MTVNDEHTGTLDQLGAAVRSGREQRGWKINEAASRAGGDARSWSAVEKGKPVKPGTYRKIADAFGIRVELIEAATRSADALPALVDALDQGSPLDPVDLDDARLFALLRACMDELESRLGTRSGQLNRIEAALSAQREVKRPDAARISQRITEQMKQKGTP